MKPLFYILIILIFGTVYCTKTDSPPSGGSNLITITTQGVSNIKGTTATSGGTSANIGNYTILEQGVCWDSLTTPTSNKSKTNDKTSVGTFVSNVTRLIPNTNYNLRAYITVQGTSGGAITIYGNEYRFKTPIDTPSLNSNSASSITSSTAIVGGNILSNGGATVTERGICWNTITMPTVLNAFKIDSSGKDNFSTTISGLKPFTIYYFRAYAKNSSGIGYGNLQTFQTAALPPTVTTASESLVTASTATTGGNVTNDFGAPITVRGICYSRTNSNPTISDLLINATSNSTGAYVINMSNLVENTTYYVRAYATNVAGTGYGSVITIKTKALLTPTITTTDPSNVAYKTASTGGNISDDGGATVTARGVAYSNITSTPTILNLTTSDGTGTGVFNSSLQNLNENTTYYVRAYATNIVGTGYGSVVTLTTKTTVVPTLTTTIVSNIGFNTASTGGSISNDGGANVTARGVVYSSVATTPTTLNLSTSDGNGTGSFNSSLQNLNENTTYYVRAYATNSAGTGYGPVQTFKTKLNSVPSLTTLNTSNIKSTSVSSGGNISDIGSSNVTEVGVCYSTTNTSPTTANITTKGTAPSAGTGVFTINITSLTRGTKYYLRAYAINSKGTGYGALETFTTPDGLPVVNTSTTVTGITPNTANVGGTVVSEGDYTISSRGVLYSKSPITSYYSYNAVVDINTGIGSYTSSITGLTPNTKYYVRAYARYYESYYGYKEVLGNEESFLTSLASAPIGVTTNTPSLITQTTADLGVSVSSSGGYDVSRRGVVLSRTNTTPTILSYDSYNYDTWNYNDINSGSSTFTFTGLQPNTTYYVRGYATNTMGTSYGSVRNFTTNATTAPPVLLSPINGVTVPCCTLNLSWSTVSGATSYQLEVSRSSTFTGITYSLGLCGSSSYPSLTGNNRGTYSTNSACINTGTSSNNGTWYWRVKANTTGATYSNVQSFVYKF